MAKTFPPHYSLLNEHDKSFEIHDARDGKSFHIPKKGLDAPTAKKIKGIQKFVDGGVVQPQPDDAPPPQEQVSQPQVSQVPVAETPAAGQGAPDLTPKVPVPVTVSTPGPNMSQMSPDQMQNIGRNPAQSPANPEDMAKQFQANSEAQNKAAGQMGDARTAELNAQAKNYETANDSMQKFFAQSQADLAHQNLENEKLAQDVASAKIDPNHYMASKSTGGKIATALSLVLGGIGSGLTRGPNLGYETLQNSINKDIDAQKANLDNKHTLLSTNLKKYGDMRLAQQATLMQMNAMTQGQIAQTSAKFGAMGNAAATQELQAKMKNDYLIQGQQLNQMLTEQKIKQHLAGGDVSQQNPLDYIQHVVPADKQKEVADEVGKAMSARRNEAQIMKLYDDARKEQTMLKTGAGYVRTSPALNSLQNAVLPLIKDKEGRINEFEFNTMKNNLPKAGQFDSTQDELRGNFQNFIKDKQTAPLAKTYGIDIDRFGSTAHGQAQPVVRETKDGKRALFNPDTKQFLGYQK